MVKTILNTIWNLETTFKKMSNTNNPIIFSRQRRIYLHNYRALDLLIAFRDPYKREIFESLDKRMGEIYIEFNNRKK